MNDHLIAYLKTLLDSVRTLCGCDWVGVFGGSAEPFCSTLICAAGTERVALGNSPSQCIFPLNYDDTNYATLVCRSERDAFFGSDEIMEKLDAFSAQISALLACANPEKAIELDQKISRLHDEKESYDWTGVYRLDGDTLKLAVFRGAPTPHIIIPKDKGICGAAVRENRTLNVHDVSSDPRYLSCDFRTRSEIVVPVRDASGHPIGEIDIDSHVPNAFGADDIRRVEELARELSPLMVE